MTIFCGLPVQAIRFEMSHMSEGEYPVYLRQGDRRERK